MYMIARIRARSGIRFTIHSPCNILFLQVCGVRRIINSLPTITVRFTSLPPSKPFTYLGFAIRAHIWSPLASSCCYHRAYHISLKSPVGTYSSCLLAMQRLGLILSSSLALTYLKCPSSGAYGVPISDFWDLTTVTISTRYSRPAVINRKCHNCSDIRVPGHQKFQCTILLSQSPGGTNTSRLSSLNYHTETPRCFPRKKKCTGSTGRF